MKKIYNEFKKFVTRGNVVDLAVGMIIGAAFTSIVKSLADGIFKPVINFLIYKASNGEGLDDAYTFLIKKFNEDGSINLTNSIFIDWGGFISAIINFLMTALVLFIVVKMINKIKDHKEWLFDEVARANKKIELGIKLTKKEMRALEEDRIEKEKEALNLQLEEAKKAEELNKVDPVVELLKEIRDNIKK